MIANDYIVVQLRYDACMRRTFLMGALACAWLAAAQDQPIAIFGTTVVIPTGLRGLVYHIHHYSSKLPDFDKLKPAGPPIYTSSLDVPPQSFSAGFPGVTKRNEWFAIDYTGRFWVNDPGMYSFSLLSDDGSKLYIDDRLLIDNDGLHLPVEKTGAAELAAGVHSIRVSYFQGPKWEVALVLKIAAPGRQLHLFSTDEMKPPPDPGQWRLPGEAKP